MAKSNKQKEAETVVGGGLLLLLAVTIFVIPFSLLIAWFQYKKIRNKLFNIEGLIRVHEGGLDAIKMTLINALNVTLILMVVFVGDFFAFAVVYEENNIEGWIKILTAVVGIVSFVGVLIWFWGASKQIGCKMIGVLLFPNDGLIVIPRDSLTNTATQDIAQAKWFKDMFSLEAIQTQSIKKITRQAGKRLFIHGDFGTRRISFSNKQKRDECIYAIERVIKKKLVTLDFE